MGRPRTRDRPTGHYVVLSYIDGVRRVHKVDAISYRDAKRKIARELREDLGLWDTNLADITSQGMMMARKVPKGLLKM